MHTFAVIVSYHPTQGLLDLVADLRGQVTQLAVVDNGSGDNPWIAQLQSWAEPWIKVVRLEHNYGIAKGLNVGIEQAQKAGAAYLLTLDQDSRLPANYVSRMVAFAQANSQKLGMVAPDFVDINTGTHARFSHLSPGWISTKTCQQAGGETLESSFAITSGALYPLSVLAQVGGFREDFFIDHVDTEHCLRLRKMGYRVLVNCAVCIQHAIGQRSVHKLWKLTIKPNHHKPLRRYYIARNGVYVGWLHGWRYPAFGWLNFMRTVHELLSIVFFEQNRKAKLGALAKGLWHGLIGRMGPA